MDRWRDTDAKIDKIIKQRGGAKFYSVIIDDSLILAVEDAYTIVITPIPCLHTVVPDDPTGRSLIAKTSNGKPIYIGAKSISIGAREKYTAYPRPSLRATYATQAPILDACVDVVSEATLLDASLFDIIVAPEDKLTRKLRMSGADENQILHERQKLMTDYTLKWLQSAYERADRQRTDKQRTETQRTEEGEGDGEDVDDIDNDDLYVNLSDTVQHPNYIRYSVFADLTRDDMDNILHLLTDAELQRLAARMIHNGVGRAIASRLTSSESIIATILIITRDPDFWQENYEVIASGLPARLAPIIRQYMQS